MDIWEVRLGDAPVCVEISQLPVHFFDYFEVVDGE